MIALFWFYFGVVYGYVAYTYKDGIFQFNGGFIPPFRQILTVLFFAVLLVAPFVFPFCVAVAAWEFFFKGKPFRVF